jgi:hypothetical protein
VEPWVTSNTEDLFNSVVERIHFAGAEMASWTPYRPITEPLGDPDPGQ